MKIVKPIPATAMQIDKSCPLHYVAHDHETDFHLPGKVFVAIENPGSRDDESE